MTLVYIISAPSGSGKSTLVAAIKRLVDRLDFSVSYTTRPPRGSEENGRDYYYTSREVFERMIGRGEFLEYADVFGNYYGTAKKFLDDAIVRGNDLLLDIDVQGASQLQSEHAGGDQHLHPAADQAGVGEAPAPPQLGRTHDRRGGHPPPAGNRQPGD